MSEILFELVLILLLILTNGVLAMSEIALVSARKAKLQHMAQTGKNNAGVALALASNPTDLLSTVQIGITLVGILAGAFGGASIAEQLDRYFRQFPWLAPYSATASLGIVVLFITYLSLVVGELVPKRLALQNPEGVSSLVARPMRGLLRITRPAVWFLGVSTGLILKALRIGPPPAASISEEEIRILIRQGMQVGVLQKSETEMLERVFQLQDRLVSSLMTPRPEIVWLDIQDTEEENRNKIENSSHSRFPVGKERLFHLQGVVIIKDLFNDCINGKPFDIASNLKQPMFVPETMPALHVLELFRKEKAHLALVIDEYGAIVGLVTLHDILQAIAGELPEPESVEEAIVAREDGSWLVDAMIAVEDLQQNFREYTAFFEEGDYRTLAGYILHKLGRIPKVGDHFESGGLRFEVVDMDGNRIDKVLLAPHQKAT